MLQFIYIFTCPLRNFALTFAVVVREQPGQQQQVRETNSGSNPSFPIKFTIARNQNINSLGHAALKFAVVECRQDQVNVLLETTRRHALNRVEL